MTLPIIIIGAGLAGWTTARELRKLDPSTPVLLITADSGDFYAKPSLSNALQQKRTPAQLVSTPAAKMAQTHNVRVVAHTRVLAIDPATRSLQTSGGDFQYSQLVLATGAQPIRVPLAGDAADQVQSINSLDDFTSFYQRLTCADQADGQLESRPRQVLIMGAGLIGCEFANDLAASGFGVTVVDPSAGPVAALLPEAVSAQLQQALLDLGVRWHFGATVKAVNWVPAASANLAGAEPALQVELSNGKLIQVDIVLSAIGLKADLSVAQTGALVCERGIVVDSTLRTSSPSIYALGDSAQYASGRWGEALDAAAAPVSGGRTLPYVLPIMSAARALAATLAGTPSAVLFPLMPVAIKTPALPIVVAPPLPGTAGEWRSEEPGLWQFIDSEQHMRGFVLSGKHSARRAEQAKLVRV
ncbi:MAG: FAD-dependent oxidoreductase [Gammaproteobacteria bacterium]|uniref:FAD-dependent oxidoreductase n=1 Tax=Rhodoferax sp. TaxID=50421 RepID=UPI0017B8B664|nr:FAD-dependent oxidoreductase [Rhodoferax sp.]MBU3899406.1 FAD-dependent oxidoreductase [Gammaproteobacteria bacterium]MBA3058426.1 pyridine nucleotide-disulfide oxidoreductase [Rhodoferax sp.]MBU3997562.1 FAD-dependent oxidoreductase [Gammaproteobacteria bacterium]MBU4080661.1 FAD-dependent oxidoreductase [Gammaproteobacteria bacterium]MBU4113559.1 FAD-dependent oxidoreductase [Gammaproteobacteria bacterium]